MFKHKRGRHKITLNGNKDSLDLHSQFIIWQLLIFIIIETAQNCCYFYFSCLVFLSIKILGLIKVMALETFAES